MSVSKHPKPVTTRESGIKITILAGDSRREKFWKQEIEKSLGTSVLEHSSLNVVGGIEDTSAGEMIFVDAETPDLISVLQQIDRAGRAVYLIVDQGREELVTESVFELVDDILIQPFRPLDLVSKLRHHRQVVMWQQLSALNVSFSETILALKDDLQLAESLQKAKLPIRFKDLKGFKAAHRYLAGLKSGGDHFDLADSKDGSQLSLLLSDSSSYGLSSAVLSVLMKVVMKLSIEDARSCSETVKKIYDELTMTLSEKDQLSLFYGIISRKDLKLRYVNFGSSCAFVAQANGQFKMIVSSARALNKAHGMPEVSEQEIKLAPGDRLALISDGFVDAAGGVEETCRLLDQHRSREAVDALNELVYQVKSKFAEPDDLPEQDCTGVIFDIDSKFL